MKIVFYRRLLNMGNCMTPSEKILYSFLVSKSIARLDCIFYTDGTEIAFDNLCMYLEENNNMIDICDINHSKIAMVLHQTRKTVIEGLKHLKELNLIGDKWIFLKKELVCGGYFELTRLDILKGELLIFYSFLKDKSARYGYCIDTFKAKIGEQIGKSKIAVTKLLNRLYDTGLAERLNNGKLLIK
jgi:hypothetical protein